MKVGKPKADLGALFIQAFSFYRSGQMFKAKQILEKLTAIAPNHVDSLHLLGIIAFQEGEAGRAEQLLRQAIILSPHYAALHNSLGNVLNADLARAEEAVACFEAAIKAMPSYAIAYNGLGAALRKLGKNREALRCYEKAVALKPDYHEAYNNLGSTQLDVGLRDNAIRSFSTAIRLNPNFAEAHFNLGSVRFTQLDFAGAAQSFLRALELKPDYVDAHTQLGLAFKQQGKLDEAILCYEHAIEHAPTPGLYSNLGVALKAAGRLDEAIHCYQRALGFDPACVEALTNLGIALKDQRKLDEAERCFKQALGLRPDFADARFGLAVVLLTKGDLPQGWVEYESRWEKTDAEKRPNSIYPLWKGEPVPEHAGILIYSEQGLGDAIQMARYLPLLQTKFRLIIFRCPAGLVRLMRNSFDSRCQIVAREDAVKLSGITHYCPIFSLPRAFNTKIESIPNAIPYLKPGEESSSKWSLASGTAGDLGVGLVWAGGSGLKDDQKRSMHLSVMDPLFEMEGVRWVSLQKGEPASQVSSVYEDMMDVESINRANDFADTAGIIANLDLVISVDTSVAHLAGALGKPVWLLSRYEGEWRWLNGREDSPWYPSMKIFSQTAAGDWDGVIRRVREELVILITQMQMGC